MSQVLDVQIALSKRGFDPGGLDGIFGRRTIAALKAFQSATGLSATGQIDEPTKKALLKDWQSAQATLPPWYLEGRRKMGLHEVRDHGILARWLKSDGRTLGDPRKLPWCGDFVETCIALTLPNEPMVTNPYLARNWMKFGTDCGATIGAVVVFWRGSRTGMSGHVGFYAGERADAVRVLGGNQSNAVTEAWLAKNRLLGYRWPTTYPKPSTGAVFVSAGGKLSTNEA